MHNFILIIMIVIAPIPTKDLGAEKYGTRQKGIENILTREPTEELLTQLVVEYHGSTDIEVKLNLLYCIKVIYFDINYVSAKRSAEDSYYYDVDERIVEILTEEFAYFKKDNILELKIL